MGEVGDGSMGSPPTSIKYLPATENADVSMLVDLSCFSSSENPDTIYASVDFVASHYREKNEELLVKVPWRNLNFLDGLRQMGFIIVEHIKFAEFFVLREGKSLPIASNATLMPRENIASSSNPCNVICNQTPGGATLPVVQSPSKTACASNWKPVAAGSGGARVGQGPEFQHSSRAFSSGPSGRGNDHRVRRFTAEPETPVQTKKSGGLPPRTRGRKYVDKDKEMLLRLRLEYHRDPINKEKPRKWLEHVTAEMNKTGGCRESVSLRGLWENIKKGRDAMRRAFPGRTADYWKLTKVEKKSRKRIDRNFPLTFKPSWYAAMNELENMDPGSTAEKETRRDGQVDCVFFQSCASTLTGSANFAGGAGSSDVNVQASVEHLGQASAPGSHEGPLENSQRTVASETRVLSNLYSLTEKNNQETYDTHEQLAALTKKLTAKSSSPDPGPDSSTGDESAFLNEVLLDRPSPEEVYPKFPSAAAG